MALQSPTESWTEELEAGIYTLKDSLYTADPSELDNQSIV